MNTYEVTVRIDDQTIRVEAESEEEAKDEAINRIDDVLNNVFASECDAVDADLIEEGDD